MSNLTNSTENKKTYSDKWLYVFYMFMLCLEYLTLAYGTRKHFHLETKVIEYLISFFFARFAHDRLQKKMPNILSAFTSFLIGQLLPLAIVSLPVLFAYVTLILRGN